MLPYQPPPRVICKGLVTEQVVKLSSDGQSLDVNELLHDRGVFVRIRKLIIEKVVEILAKNDTWQIPTLKLYKNFAFKSYKEKEYLSYLELLPKNIREN